jgi:hypothetical protein
MVDLDHTREFSYKTYFVCKIRNLKSLLLYVKSVIHLFLVDLRLHKINVSFKASLVCKSRGHLCVHVCKCMFRKTCSFLVVVF